MIRRLIALLLLVATLSLVAGCWNRRELNTLAIAVGLGIDKTGDQYQVSVQVVNPELKNEGVGRSPVILYRATGTSVSEALRKMTKESPRIIYASHLRILVIGESPAKEGIADVLDYLFRDHEFRNDFYIIVAKHTKAENILKVMTSLEKISSIELFHALETSELEWAPTRKVTLNELISDLTEEGKQAVLTGIEIKGDQQAGQTEKNTQRIAPSSRLQYSGFAVFNADKLIGWLDEDDSKAYNYITNRVTRTVGQMTCPGGGVLSNEVIRSRTAVKGKQENGKPSIDVFVRIEQNVGEVACHVDLNKLQTIEEINRLTNRKVERLIERSIETMQKKYKVDIYGFGQVIHRAEPKLWKRIGKDWDSYFVDLPVNVKVDTKTRRLGIVGNSFIEDMKK